MGKDDINAFLGAGTHFKGILSFDGAVRIDGTFTGEITSPGTLIIGKEAKVEGTVQVGHLVLSGLLTGDVVVEHKAVLHCTGVLSGNITVSTVVMEEGACLEGSVTMIDRKTE